MRLKLKAEIGKQKAERLKLQLSKSRGKVHLQITQRAIAGSSARSVVKDENEVSTKQRVTCTQSLRDSIFLPCFRGGVRRTEGYLEKEQFYRMPLGLRTVGIVKA